MKQFKIYGMSRVADIAKQLKKKGYDYNEFFSGSPIGVVVYSDNTAETFAAESTIDNNNSKYPEVTFVQLKALPDAKVKVTREKWVCLIKNGELYSFETEEAATGWAAMGDDVATIKHITWQGEK